MRTRPDYRTDVLEQLRLHGPMNFGRLYRYIRPPVRDDLDYDLRCLRREGLIRTIPGKLWVIGT